MDKAGYVCFVVVTAKGAFRDLRRCGGEDGFRDSVRTRGVLGCAEAVAEAVAIDDDGTTGRSPRGAGRRLPFKPRNGSCDGMLNEDFVAELGGGGIWNEPREPGVEGGSRDAASARAT